MTGFDGISFKICASSGWVITARELPEGLFRSEIVYLRAKIKKTSEA